MNNINLKYFILSLVMTIGFSSCSEEFIDGGSPVDQITDAGFWDNQSNYISVLNSCYNEFEWMDAAGRDWVTHANYPTYDLNNGEVFDMINYYNPNNSSIETYWETFYLVIHNTNQVIRNLQSNESFSPEITDRIDGEAKFLRGFSYFNLARAFGGLPLILEPNSADDSKDIARSTAAETWEQVIKDLSDAELLLPEKWEDLQGYDVGRPLKGSALAYRMIAYMYQEEWAKAITDAQKIMSLSRGYKLLDDIRDVFSVANENSEESMFEIQYWGGPGGWLRTINGQFLQESTMPRGIGNQYSEFGGWGNMYPREDLVMAFEPTDLRRQKLFLALGETYMGEFFPEPFVWDDIKNVPDGYICTKYWTGKTNAEGPGHEQNLPQLRFADVLLNYAECLMRIGDLEGAYEQLNKIRNRAGLKDKNPSTNQQFLDDLILERRLETFIEPNIWWDMVRSGVATDHLEENYGIIMDPKWELMPIPQSELDLNDLLVQNPGY